MTAAAAIGGGATAVALLWPGAGPAILWPGADQLVSILGVALTALSVMLAYLTWRASGGGNGVTDHPAPQGFSGDPTIAAVGDPSARKADPVAAQLPPDTAVFTGRQAELAELLASSQDPQRATAVVITAIDGLGGVGKTALAVHAAHQLIAHYPDGQLFIDLKGFTDNGAPVEPIDALERLLRAVGVSGQQVPPGLDERAALWRSVLTGRRMLLVFDNAASVEQVSSLLPGGPGCLVLVTSRRRLAGLPVATREVSLDMLPPVDAMALFVRVAGAQRLTAEPEPLLAEAVELCWRLPLAISVAAGMLKAHPVWTIGHLVDRLRDEDQRTSELADGHRSVTAVLDLSYLHLTAEHQRLYRLLSLHPGPDIDAYATAALACVQRRQARRLLDELLKERLLREPAAGRYTFHNLVRSHASAAADAAADTSAHQSAMGNLLDYYRHAMTTATEVVYPQDGSRQPSFPIPDTQLPCLADPTQAAAWLDAELPNLLATAHYAADHGWPGHAVHASTILRRHLVVRGHYRDAERLHSRASALAPVVRDRCGELTAQLGLGDLHRLQGRCAQAGDHYRQALEVARLVGNRSGELDALNGLGHVSRGQGRYELAHDYFRQALSIAHTIGHHTGELNAHLGLGDLHRLQRRYGDAGDHYMQALDIARATRNSRSQLAALGALGDTRQLEGRHAEAADHYLELSRLASTSGDRLAQLYTLVFLGDIRRRQRRYEQAVAHYQDSLRIALEMNDRTGEVEALLGLGKLRRAEGQLRASLRHHYRALTLAVELGHLEEQARAHNCIAYTRNTMRQRDWARFHWQQALHNLRELGIERTADLVTCRSALQASLADLDNHRQ